MGESRNVDRHGKLRTSYLRREYSSIRGGSIDSEIRRKNYQPQKGIRQTVLEAYNRGGREEALKELEAINRRLGKTVYTVEMMDTWIKQAKFKASNQVTVQNQIKEQNQGQIEEQGRNDDDAR